MPKPVFRLASLQKYRGHQRDLCRQYLAEALADQRGVESELAANEHHREQQLDEIRDKTGIGRVNIDAIVSRRFHAGQLAHEIRTIKQRLDLVLKQVDLCRRALIQADQRVKALEKLEEKQLNEFLFEQERKASREREENWIATHAYH